MKLIEHYIAPHSAQLLERIALAEKRCHNCGTLCGKRGVLGAAIVLLYLGIVRKNAAVAGVYTAGDNGQFASVHRSRAGNIGIFSALYLEEFLHR